jgi:hypothetical protein
MFGDLCGGVGSKTVYRLEFGLGPAGVDVFPIRRAQNCNPNGQMMSIHNNNTQKIVEATVTITASPTTTGYPQTNQYTVNPGGDAPLGCTVFNNVSLNYEMTYAIYK